MPKKKKPNTDVTGDVKYLELIAEDFKDYIKESKSDIRDISNTMSDMKSDFNRELGGIQQAITGQNARIKKVEEKASSIKNEFSQLSVKHPNGSSKYMLWRMLPWLVMALISGAAFTGYAFSELSIPNDDMIEKVEKRLNRKIDKEMNKLGNDIDYLIEQESDGGM